MIASVPDLCIYVFTFNNKFVILVFSRFGFEGWIWVLIASAPGLCILFTFINGR